MPWEYKIVRSKEDLRLEYSKRQSILNNEGRDDWECIKIDNMNVFTEFTFKRYIKPPPKPRKKREPVKS